MATKQNTLPLNVQDYTVQVIFAPKDSKEVSLRVWEILKTSYVRQSTEQ